MSMTMKPPLFVLLVFFWASPLPLRAQEEFPLRLSDTIPLPEISGRLEHMSVDPATDRLFLAAYGEDRLAVIDLKNKNILQAVPGFNRPLGVRYIPEVRKLYVSNDGDGSLQILSGDDLTPAARFTFTTSASNIGYDARQGRVYAGFGTGTLAAVDARTDKLVTSINFTGHPSSFAIDDRGGRVYINASQENRIVIIDLQAGAPVALLPLLTTPNNFAMALDAAGRRLFVGCRRPGQLLVLDCDSRKAVATLPIDDGVNDLFYDEANRRIYASCGDGALDVIRQIDRNTYAVMGSLRTPRGASSSLFLPERKQLLLAVPDFDTPSCEIRIYDVLP